MPSAYVVQTQIISLGDRPFAAEKAVRRPFRGIIGSKNCFDEMKDAILSTRMPGRMPPQPFVKQLGAVCFSVESLRLYSSSPIENLPNHELEKADEVWGVGWQEATGQVLNNLFKYMLEIDDVFGYDAALKDQRMNHLFFEVWRPLFLKASVNGRTVADGRVFVHLYPSGYVVLHLAIALKAPNDGSTGELANFLKETYPNSSHTTWRWSSSLASGSLSHIVRLIRQNVMQSLFASPPDDVHDSDWHYALRVRTERPAEALAEALFSGEFESEEIGVFPHHPGAPVRDKYSIDFWLNERDPFGEHVLTSRRGLIYLFSPARMRKSMLINFWKAHSIYEFILVKNQIYGDYAEFLRSSLVELKAFRRSIVRKLTQDDLLDLSVYDFRMPVYLLALDRHTKTLPSYYRWIYASISAGAGFDGRRARAKELVSEWEEEVDKWEPALSLLWKKLFSPLRTLLIKN
jgi:hypothetical protein